MTIKLAIVCSFVLFTISGAYARDYEIRLDRDARVGERYAMTATGAKFERMVMTAAAEELRKTASYFEAELHAAVTVLEIDERRREQKLDLTVSKFLVTMDGEELKETLPPGTRVIAQLAMGKQEFLVEGKPVAKALTKVLGQLIQASSGKGSDDEVFGSVTRRKEGESWPVNGVKAAAYFSERGITVKAEDITGTTTFGKLVDAAGTQSLQISSRVDLQNVAPPLPQGLAVESSTINGSFSGHFPVDPAKRPPLSEMAMKLTLTGKGKLQPDGPEVTVVVESEQARRVTMTPLEQAGK